MTVTKEQIGDLDYDEVQSIREAVCKRCMTNTWFNTSGCWKSCEAFAEAATKAASSSTKGA